MATVGIKTITYGLDLSKDKSITHWKTMDDSPPSGNVIVLRQLHTGGYYIYKTDRFHGRVEIGINILFPPVM